MRRSEDRRRSTGCFRFGEHWDKPAEDLIIEAFTECIQDAGIGRDEIEAFRGRRIVGPGPSSVLGPSSTFSLISRIGLEHKLDEILEEAARVREELGYVNMVTPTSQLVGTQAVINVVQGERYRTVPDEVIRYALGHYGKPLAPLAPDVLDRIHQTPAARLYTSREPEKSVIERVRARFGGGISDEDVLLPIMFPEEHVEAMLAAPPLAGRPPSVATPLVDLVRALVTERRFASVRLDTPEVRVTARARPA
ncbi:MAG: hypothetical protein HYV93_21340 [Candidatus Rokubacteria bacterium]|nr:hypothetical protein [Candidatus Rokubacteria bacterium]